MASYALGPQQGGGVIFTCFLINLHKKDKALYSIKVFFGVGKFDKNDSKSIQFIVFSIKELEVIINHFDKYPLVPKTGRLFII